MNKFLSWMHIRQSFRTSWAVLPLAMFSVAAATEDMYERTQLTLMLRQVETLQRMAERGMATPPQFPSRYHFDYGRLREDLSRVRTGVQDYLSPQRAQPRDTALMHGDYRNEDPES